MFKELKDCDMSQTVSEFIQNNTITGNVSLKSYGEYADNWMAVLPFFELNIVASRFSMENPKKVPKKVRRIMDENICFNTGLWENAMLFEIINIGNGPAFQVTLEGVSPFYEQPVFQSAMPNKPKYVL